MRMSQACLALAVLALMVIPITMVIPGSPGGDPTAPAAQAAAEEGSGAAGGDEARPGPRGDEYLFTDSFERASLGPYWTYDPGWSGIGGHTYNSTNRSMYIYGVPVNVTSQIFDASSVNKLVVGYWARRGSSNFSESPDNGEDLFVEYRTQSGVWNQLARYYGSGPPAQIFVAVHSLPRAAFHSNFQLRFRHAGGSGHGCDFWHVDDVFISQDQRAMVEVTGSDKAPAEVTQCDKNVTMLRLVLTGKGLGTQVSSMKIKLTGTGDDGDVALVRLFDDKDGSGDLSYGDQLAGKGTFADGNVTFQGPWSLTKGATFEFVVVYDIEDLATVDATVGARLSPAGVKVPPDARVDMDLPVGFLQSKVTERGSELTVTPADLVGNTIERGGTDTPVMKITLSSDWRDIVLKALEMELAGDCPPDHVDAVRVYRDADHDCDLMLDRDELVSAGTFTGGPLALSELQLSVVEGQPEILFVTFDMSLNSTVGTNAGVTLASGAIDVKKPDTVGEYLTFTAGPATVRDTRGPPAPGGLTVDEVTHSTVALHWSPVECGDLAGYNLYRRGPEQQHWGEPVNGLDPIPDIWYVDTGLEELTTYHYMVTAVDGVPNDSEPSSAVYTTTPMGPHGPELTNAPEALEMVEDEAHDSMNLKRWFVDPNGDELEFKSEGAKYLTVKIDQDTGGVEMTPRKDWNGEEALTFTADDGTDKASHKLLVTVTGVNDPPRLPLITSPKEGASVAHGTPLTFTALGQDPDVEYGDSLTFTWRSSISGIIGFGHTLADVKLSPDRHIVTLEVTDLESASSSTTVNVTVNPKKNTDSDGDGLPDLWERARGLDPHDPDDAREIDNATGLTYMDAYNEETGNTTDDDEEEEDTGEKTGGSSNAPSSGGDDRSDSSQMLPIVLALIIIIALLAAVLTIELRRSGQPRRTSRSLEVQPGAQPPGGPAPAAPGQLLWADQGGGQAAPRPGTPAGQTYDAGSAAWGGGSTDQYGYPSTRAPAPQALPPHGGPRAGGAGSGPGEGPIKSLEAISKLNDLRLTGAINEEEFHLLKTQVISGGNSS